MKEKIEKRDKDWDIFKKYTNPYEYIHTLLPFKRKCIAKHKPLSRSYFKMIEMVNIFDLFFDSRPIQSFHLAEGPGGFIEALVELRKCQHDKYIGMTILDETDDPNIPAWKKTEYFLRQNKNIVIETGADKTGNVLSLENLLYCKEKYGSNMDIITADGGFDFSLDFNNQEISIAKLLFAQVSFALLMQKKGGSFILKIFDVFMQHSIDILYILSSFYDKVYIVKPHTSRYANSEKYIVCKGFTSIPVEQFAPFIYRTFEKMVSSSNSSVDLYIHRFLNTPITTYFLTRIEEYNAIFGQQQVENIHHTITFIDNKHKQDKIDNLINANIQKCILWCNKYNVPQNQLMYSSNIFLSNTVSNDESSEC
jgi:23S rRNA U2552 (ribose-2'-O)-methylase RlmE/FtsJ